MSVGFVRSSTVRRLRSSHLARLARLAIFGLVVVASAATAASAASPPTPTPVAKPADWPFDEFRYLGSLACKHRSTTESENDNACLLIGAIRVEQTVAQVEAITGKASAVVEGQAGEEIRVYSLRGAAEPPPYLAVGFVEGKVSSIQLSGNATSEPYAFSSLTLGDTADKVTQILGPPAARNPMKDVPGDLWSYRPFPISLEVHEGRVVSIKIWKPSAAK